MSRGTRSATSPSVNGGSRSSSSRATAINRLTSSDGRLWIAYGAGTLFDGVKLLPPGQCLAVIPGAGRRNHRLLIWSLLSVEFMQRHFTNNAVPTEKAA